MKDEKKYSQLLKIIDGLKPGTKFEITVDWCASQGLDANPNEVKNFGRKFAQEYENHGCEFLVKTSDNLRHYKKIKK